MKTMHENEKRRKCQLQHIHEKIIGANPL